MDSVVFEEKDYLACCGSTKFAKEMVSNGPFPNYNEAVDMARDVWFNKVNVNGWLETFAAAAEIGQTASFNYISPTSAQFISLFRAL